jgi:hypothetical protein
VPIRNRGFQGAERGRVAQRLQRECADARWLCSARRKKFLLMHAVRVAGDDRENMCTEVQFWERRGAEQLPRAPGGARELRLWLVQAPTQFGRTVKREGESQGRLHSASCFRGVAAGAPTRAVRQTEQRTGVRLASAVSGYKNFQAGLIRNAAPPSGPRTWRDGPECKWPRARRRKESARCPET